MNDCCISSSTSTQHGSRSGCSTDRAVLPAAVAHLLSVVALTHLNGKQPLKSSLSNVVCVNKSHALSNLGAPIAGGADHLDPCFLAIMFLSIAAAEQFSAVVIHLVEPEFTAPWLPSIPGTDNK